MDISFELLSSMSPKINRNGKTSKKTPTILALKKHIRRSSSVISTFNNPRKDESILTIESSVSTPKSSRSSESPILISESSEASFSDYKSIPYISSAKEKSKLKDVRKNEQKSVGGLSAEKFCNIKHWVDEVNSVKKNTSIFNEVSTICGEDNPCLETPATNIAAHSTFLQPTSRRFDDLFKNSHLLNREIVKESSENGNIVLNDSLITKDCSLENNHNSLISADNSLAENCKNMVLEDSLELDLNDGQNTPIERKSYANTEFETPPNKGIPNAAEYEDLLDSIYGNSWRQRKEDVLPSSEPQLKRKETKTDKNVNTERPAKAINVYRNPCLSDENDSNGLLKTLHKARLKKALESPWMNSLKNVCDSDNSHTSNFNLSPMILNFQEDKDLTCKKIPSSEAPSIKVQIKSQKVSNESSTKTSESKTETGIFSFLASLAANVPVPRSDVSALIYKKNFKQYRGQLASKLFKLYNKSIFENAIPNDTPLEWNDRMRGTAGYCYCRKITRRTGATERAVRIVISSKVVDSADRLRDTLVHEMCHAVTWIVNQVADGHGSFWRSWADRAMKIFPELPPIKRCHQYVINTKYTYRCEKCGYSIGRHTKSLDVERKRCGYCYGKFEILINKTTKKGETKTVPVTPKKAPTGFALFVKENYATFKTPELRHADVMKMLGQKFSDLKVDKS